MLLRIPTHLHPSPTYRTIQYSDDAEVQVLKHELDKEIGLSSLSLHYFDVLIKEQEGQGILRTYTSALFESESHMDDEIVAMILRSEGKLEANKFKKRGRR